MSDTVTTPPITDAAAAPPREAPRHRVGQAAVALLAWPTIAATLVGFAGGVWWFLDLASHFRVQYVLVLAVSTLLAALMRWWRMVLTAMIALAINVLVIAPLFIAPSATPAKDAPPLRIVSFNVLTSNTEHDATISFMLNEDADLVLLMEVDPDWIVDLEFKAIGYHRIATNGRTDNYGIVLLARDASADLLTVESARVFDVTDGVAKVPAAEAKVRWANRPLSILGLHTRTPVRGDTAALRNAQLAAAGDWVAAQQTPVIVMGDLNATPWCAPMRDLMSRTDLVDSMRGYGVQASWPRWATLASIPIDHVLHSPQLVTVDRRLGDVEGSDHRPVIVTLAWKE